MQIRISNKQQLQEDSPKCCWVSVPHLLIFFKKHLKYLTIKLIILKGMTIAQFVLPLTKVITIILNTAILFF